MVTSTARRVNPIATVVSVVAAGIAVIIVLHIILFVFEANPANGAVETIADWADWLTRWARDVFTPDNVKARVAANYGLAAVVYLAVGAFVSRLVSRV
ncbi:hypothetical protein [Streptomyces sp. SID3343]|uniref:hypothetical protein n=1 Tax=Streptomyces sp. SID3343 TaxID=2690260 RepID=UPI00136A894E|nr:hypothetical protein [Streptomyces sp. SID3343]MYW01397.1 hypothetical protein [Streptomyces sp. SID3343]